MTRCVPPGSVLGILGPVLFNILVNELMMGQTVLSEIFADDNKLGGVALVLSHQSVLLPFRGT